MTLVRNACLHIKNIFFLQVQIVKVMHKIKRISKDQIAVLTPYTSQKEVILNALSNQGFSEITVQTVTESQGTYVHTLCL